MLILTIAALLAQAAQNDYTPAVEAWNQPVDPFRIEGNLYYVGASDVSSFLLTSPQGHVLLDSGFRETVPQIVANVKKLGFQLADIRYLVLSQAHYDHAAGLAELKRLIPKAQLLASAEDAKLLARGGKGDFAFQDRFLFEPVKADRILKDGEKIKLGDVELKTMFTPGHTKGCTTFATRIGQKNAVFVCSVSSPDYKLKGNPKYPNIVEDFERTFDLLEKTPCDIYLSAHASQFNMDAKRKSGNFVDKNELAEMIRQARADFRKKLATAAP